MFLGATGQYWPSISFNGSGSGVPWFVYPVGGVTITGNMFKTHQDQYIRARGIYDTSTFDWNSYFSKNTFPGGHAYNHAQRRRSHLLVLVLGELLHPERDLHVERRSQNQWDAAGDALGRLFRCRLQR